MTMKKYKLGKRLTSMAEFEQSDKAFLIIRFKDALGRAAGRSSRAGSIRP